MKKGQIIAVVAALVVTIALYLASRTPESSASTTTEASTQAEETVSEPLNELDLKVNQAVEIIQSGQGSPMQAIGLLREVVQVDSNHIEANYWLGQFSVMSGQFDKAVKRFEKLHRLKPDNVEYCIKLAQAYKGAGQPNRGVEVLEEFLQSHPEENVKEQIESVLEEISVQL